MNEKSCLGGSVVRTEGLDHIAIIMDGNRRWAKQKGFDCTRGHNEGAVALRNTVQACLDLNVKTLTAYSFSTENWLRPDLEVKALFEVFIANLLSMKDDMIANGVKLDTIGNLRPLPKGLNESLTHVKEQTSGGQKLNLVLALNYGARDEMCRAVGKILIDYKNNKFSHENFNESVFANYLDTANYSDPDLVIRTASESRLSNFLLYQISYSEVYISDVLWPDFDKNELIKAVGVFNKRKRKYGE